MTVAEAIEAAERVLPGESLGDSDQIDDRWQVIIAVGEYVVSHPLPVWEFASRWGVHEDEDLRDAIATCVLEHLLEHHFALVFPLVVQRAAEAPLFVDTLRRCWLLGAAGEVQNADHLRAVFEGREPLDT